MLGFTRHWFYKQIVALRSKISAFLLKSRTISMEAFLGSWQSRQLVKKVPDFCRIRRLIFVFNRANHGSTFWARRIQSKNTHHVTYSLILNYKIAFVSVLLRFYDKNSVTISYLPLYRHASYSQILISLNGSTGIKNKIFTSFFEDSHAIVNLERIDLSDNAWSFIGADIRSDSPPPRTH